jgi:hypothetical protein
MMILYVSPCLSGSLRDTVFVPQYVLSLRPFPPNRKLDVSPLRRRETGGIRFSTVHRKRCRSCGRASRRFNWLVTGLSHRADKERGKYRRRAHTSVWPTFDGQARSRVRRIPRHDDSLRQRVAVRVVHVMKTKETVLGTTRTCIV